MTSVFSPENNGRPSGTYDLEIRTPRGEITGLLHRIKQARSGMIMAGDAEGGLTGPAGVYGPLGDRLQHAGIASMRLEYRHPNELDECVFDVLAAIEALRQTGAERVALLGWSFGGLVVITAGALSRFVAGVAAVASRGVSEAVADLSPKSLLLLHGTADEVSPDRCSRELYERAREPKELVLYPDDDHNLTRHAEAVLEKLCEWSCRRLLTV